MSTPIERPRVKGGVLGALTSVALAAGALGAGAPTANATCASFFGIGNTGGCWSNLTSVAIAIGDGAEARANGLFGAAFSIGTEARASFADSYLNVNVLNLAVATGDHAYALAGGVLGVAAQLGQNGRASAGPFFLSLGNIAVGVSPGNRTPGGTTVFANGMGNVAVNLFGTGDGDLKVAAIDIGTFAANLGGNNNRVVTQAGLGTFAANLGGSNNRVMVQGDPITLQRIALSAAFNICGSGNEVLAEQGPLAVAGSILQTDKTIEQVGPGFSINGFRLPNTAAATGDTMAAAATAPVTRAGKRTAAAAIVKTDKTIEQVGPGFNIDGLKVPDTAAAGDIKPAAATAPVTRAGKRTASADSGVGGRHRSGA